jgi:hypothetical protein
LKQERNGTFVPMAEKAERKKRRREERVKGGFYRGRGGGK